jgi:hypothetical protein
MYKIMRIGKAKAKSSTYYNREKKEKVKFRMKRKLIIDGNAVYEIDEDCMLRKRMDENKEKKEDRNNQDTQEQSK